MDSSESLRSLLALCGRRLHLDALAYGVAARMMAVRTASHSRLRLSVFTVGKNGYAPHFCSTLLGTFRRWLPVAYAETAVIGKRYWRQDAIGLPICVTIDSGSS